MGADPIALPALDFLWKQQGSRLKLKAVYTQPDRARGRGKKVQANEIKQWALERGVPVFQPEVWDEAALEAFESGAYDFAMVMAYGHLLKKRVLNALPKGIYNLHASLLPHLRGASPIETAVATGEIETGVTLMGIVAEMDAGPIFGVERISIEELDTGRSVREKLATACVPLLSTHLDALVSGTIQGVEQVHAEATYCRILVKQDGQLDFSQAAHLLARRIQGLSPWPGCYTYFGDTLLKVAGATYDDQHCDVEPGTILETGKEGIRVATGEGSLLLREWQRPGGKRLPAADFLRGFQLMPGDKLESRTMHPLIFEKPVPRKQVFALYQ